VWARACEDARIVSTRDLILERRREFVAAALAALALSASSGCKDSERERAERLAREAESSRARCADVNQRYRELKKRMAETTDPVAVELLREEFEALQPEANGCMACLAPPAAKPPSSRTPCAKGDPLCEDL